ncbi:DNA alkylation repair protein [Sulfurimonas sp. HSL3-7]|uniref:DNA alkylation repair protein n=1 Tax=Sulfonitrofixus jiaomeiensis TaxID=3131938 RepID=UPI0031F7B64D
MEYQEIIDHLYRLADPKTAEQSQRFFKTAEGEYGFGDKFLGIRVPLIRQAVKKYETAPFHTIEKLLMSAYHEVRLFALLLLVFRFSKSSAAEQEAIYHLYLNNTRYVNSWDLVDSSAPYIVGVFLYTRERAVLYELARSDLLWERRIAIMATFHFIQHDQFTDTLRIAKLLLNDPEELIHKAVGWMLREVGKRDLAAETAFLQENYHKMPRTMLRYAIEKFSIEERSNYMQGKI